MAKTVVGNYANATDALNYVNTLIDQGYPKDSISIIANKSAADTLMSTGVKVERDFEYVEGATDETLWERIKAFFGRENTRLHETSLADYRDSILDGNVLVLVDDDMLPESLTDHFDSTYSVDMDNTAYLNNDVTDENTIRLREEQMDVSKHQVETGKAIIHKRVVEDTKTIEVPVRHEEIVIERTTLSGNDVNGADFKDETITIPVMEEQVEVTKHPVMTGEIHISKRDVENVEQVSASLRREELEVQQDGKTIIVDNDRIK